MKELLEKLTDKEKARLRELCEEIDGLFNENENEFNNENIDEYHRSKLYNAISDVLFELEVWC